MSGIIDWMKRHQVPGFYILVFGISWPAMIVAFWVFPDNIAAQSLFGLAAAFCPALVAMLVVAVSKPSRLPDSVRPRLISFVGAWLLSSLAITIHIWHVRGVPLGPQTIVPSAVVAILPAWLLSCAFSRITGVKELFGTILRPKGHVLWYVAAISLVPAVQMAGAGMTRLAGGDVTFNLRDTSFFGASAFIGLTFLQGFLVAGGINEETGWRGFVLPRLQARYPVLGAVVIVWFFWALWHIPYDIGNGTPLESIVLNRILFNFIWAVLFAWVYNRTRGSLLAPAIFHPAMNAFGDTLPGTDAATVLFLIIVLVIIVRERMWQKLPTDHPAVHT